MFKTIVPVVAFLIISSAAFAQKAEVKGNIRDTSGNSNLKNAVVALLSPKDSVLRGFTRTGEDGSYSLKNMPEGPYILLVMHPSFADYVEDVDVKSPVATISSIAVTPKSKLLEAIILKSGSPMRIKGDTTIYTADSFNVAANANVEELLKKMPGFQVDKNGEIKQMGEVVEKVLVDGEEFFGDDPGMAVKNLRADAIKEVQVFNKKSDQAEFTGIDDGKTTKTINLKLKEDKKTGHFGKIDVSGGPQKTIDDRYNTNLMFSSFKGKRKFTGFLLGGNTGQDGLSWQDNDKYGGESDNYSMSMDEDGGVMYSWRGGGSDDEPYVDTDNGFIKNINAGAQYSNKWNDKQTLNLSPKYNSQVYDNLQQTFVRQQTSNNVLFDSSVTDNHVNRSNIKLVGIYDAKLDSNNSLKLTLRSNFYHTENESDYSLRRSDENNVLTNTTLRHSNAETDKQSFSANVIFKHKFKKARRTLSVTADWNLLNTDGTNFLKSDNQDFIKSTSILVDQKIETDKSTQRLTSKLVYTEPLNKKFSLELGHELTLNYGNNDQVVRSFNPITNQYDVAVDSLTNDFDSKIIINKPSARISFNDKKIKFNFGTGVGFTQFDLIDKTFNKDYTRNYTNFFPSATFTYTYKSNHNLRFNYNGYTTQPTINQLQPLRNNNDQFNQYIGNPNLKPSFANSFNISHSSYNFLKDIWTYQSLNAQVTSNSITNSRRYDGGSIISQPINTDGNYSASFWSGLGMKIKKIDTRFNVGPSLSYNQFKDVIDNVTNTSKTLSTGVSVSASKSKDKKYDVSASNDFQFNRNTNSINTGNNNKYTTNTSTVYATLYIKKVWSISTDYRHYYRGKLNETGQNLNNDLWNARAQRTFKDNEFTVYFLVRDILNQNIGIDRTFYGNTYTETRNERLKRYFMLGFSWDFKNKGAKAK